MIVTLCGSTRFKHLFDKWMARLALKGYTVLGLSMFGREATDTGKDGNVLITEDQKITLDLVHLNKIRISDVVLVLNQDNYVGASTAREIQWARMLGKQIIWLEEICPTYEFPSVTDRWEAKEFTAKETWKL